MEWTTVRLREFTTSWYRKFYAYAGNDPTDKADPSGTMCDGGSGGGTLGDDCGAPQGAIVAAGGSDPKKTAPQVRGNPQVTPTPGHDKASVNLANEMVADAEANGETVDSIVYNKNAKNATDGMVQSNKRNDVNVNSTAKDGTKNCGARRSVFT